MTQADKYSMGRTLLQELGQLPGDADLEFCLRTIEGGAKLHLSNSEKETALHLAAFYGYDAVVEKLVAHGAPLDAQNANGHTPLMLAASLGHLNVLQQLLDAGANLYLKNIHNETVFDRAEATGFSSNDVIFRRQRPIITALRAAEQSRLEAAERQKFDAELSGGLAIKKPITALKPPKFR